MQLTPGSFFDTLKLDPQISEETITRYEKNIQFGQIPLEPVLGLVC